MPRIPEKVVRSVFYLYESEEDARAGINPGGTGFIVDTGINYDPSTKGFSLPHFYGVTNWHVACDGFPVIRLNTVDGGIDVLDFNPDQWEFLPGKYDVAVIPLSSLDRTHDVNSISTGLFAPKDYNPYYIGDDVFMVGLFVDHAGETTNLPSARFGNISMLPNSRATIRQPTGYDGISYIVDMHSRTGFSGSPVFAYRTFGSDLTEGSGHRFEHIEIENWDSDVNRSGRLKANTLFHFLGIHWAQFPEEWEINRRQTAGTNEQAKRKGLLLDGDVVEGLSGMTCVLPAWQILEVLNMPKLTDQREKENRELAINNVSNPKSPDVHSADTPPARRE